MGRLLGCISEGKGGKECGLIFFVGFPKTRHVNSALNGEINKTLFFFFLLKRSLNYKSTIKKYFLQVYGRGNVMLVVSDVIL